MTAKVFKDKDGNLIFECGPTPPPTDHKCDLKGPTAEVDSWSGKIYSASCSVCGRTAFQEWDIW